MRASTVVCWFCLVAWCVPSVAAEPATGSISGTVSSPGGEPATDARVTLVELRRSVFVDDAGRFRFDDVPIGEYHLQAVSQAFGSSVREIRLRGGAVNVDLSLDVSPHRERIVVSAAHDRGSGELAQPVGVLDHSELSEALAPTLGETLDGEPGVGSTYFGPGASRPVIRGQGGGRISVLEGGLSVGDASTTSPDHAVGSDPIAAERIEILRGPATLLYGSTAVGGVVNVIDRRVPEYAARDAVGGVVSLRHGGAADETAGAASLDGGIRSFAWHVDVLSRDAGDVDVPGAVVRGDETGPSGRLPNSSLESTGATVGASWVHERGFVGAAFRTFETNYGIPVALEDAGAPGIRIDLEQRRVDVRGRRDLAGPFVDVRFALGATDYEHRELEDGAVGTRFLTDTVEGRVEARHEHGRWAGVVGAQVTARDAEAVGDEAFVPPSTTDTVAVFALEDLHVGDMRWEFGARVENGALDTPLVATPQPGVCVDARGRDLTGTSGSVGFAWLPGETYAVSASLAYTERLPSAEELYSCGAHAATQSFEIGDPDLREERSVGLDVTVRKRAGRVTGALTLFANRYDDYVLELPTGAMIDGLPVFRFGQVEAEFRGVEFDAVLELLHWDGRHLDVEFQADRVDAEERGTGADLPFVTPTRYSVGVRWESPSWYAAVNSRRVEDAGRAVVTSFDVAGRTDAYSLLEARVGYRLVGRGLVHDIMLRGTNLGDADARNHSSRLRDRVPLPGRGVEAVYRVVF